MNRFRFWMLASLAVLVLAVLGFSCLVAVDETEYALVTSFGEVVAIHGREPGTAGLHGKLPWQSVLRVDRRLRTADPAPREVITADKRNLEVAPYLVYRVADPLLFVRGAGSLEQAEARLGERVSAALSDAIGLRDLAALATTEPSRWALDALCKETLAAVSPAARSELGVDVVDLGLSRFNHPLEVRPAVFELIRSERRQVAARLRAEGEAQYTTIISQADRGRDAILAQADAEAERIRGHAQAESTRILNEAHARDPRFYELTRTLESYGSILDPKTTIVLSSSSPLLKMLYRGPGEETTPEPPRDAAGQKPPPPTAGAPEEESMNRRLALLVVLLSTGALVVALTGFCAVRPGEQVVLRRFGRLVKPAWGPGLHWGLPLGIDRIDRVRTDLVRRLVLGERDPDDAVGRPRRGRVPDGRSQSGARSGGRPVPRRQPGRDGDLRRVRGQPAGTRCRGQPVPFPGPARNRFRDPRRSPSDRSGSGVGPRDRGGPSSSRSRDSGREPHRGPPPGGGGGGLRRRAVGGKPARPPNHGSAAPRPIPRSPRPGPAARKTLETARAASHRKLLTARAQAEQVSGDPERGSAIPCADDSARLPRCDEIASRKSAQKNRLAAWRRR